MTALFCGWYLLRQTITLRHIGMQRLDINTKEKHSENLFSVAATQQQDREAVTLLVPTLSQLRDIIDSKEAGRKIEREKSEET